jgi:hypothetical protein
MSAEFFYRTYSKFSRRNTGIRLKITPPGIIFVSTAVISGLAGLNIFESGLYRISIFCFVTVAFSYFSRPKSLPELKAGVFFDRQFNAGEMSKYTVKIYNAGDASLNDIEIVPVTAYLIPSEDEFLNIKEPGEEKRNFWDRNIYYFRWMWHILRLYKAEFNSVKIEKIESGSQFSIITGFRAVKRGKLRFEGFYLLKKDNFGIFTTSVFIPAPDEIVILPKKTEISKTIDKHIQISLELRGRSLTSALIRHKTGDFSGLRDYAPGDPFKNIHWKAWAKTGKPAVIEKSIEKIREYSVILLNVSLKTENEDFSMRFEDCLSYMISTFYRLEQNSFEMNFIHFDKSGCPVRFHADKDMGNYAALYNRIAEITYYSFDPDQCIPKLKPMLEPGSNLMVFSPVCDPVLQSFRKDFNSMILACGETKDVSSEIIAIPPINEQTAEVNLP